MGRSRRPESDGTEAVKVPGPVADGPQVELLLRSYCKQLRMPTLVANARKFAQEAARANHGYERYLLALLEQEVIQRQRNRQMRRIKAAKFPMIYTLDGFDFGVIPSLNRALVVELARGEWLERKENVILVGDIGTGKTHIATALGMAACQLGKRVRFYTAAGLVNDLIEARDDYSLGKLQASLLKQDLILLDEVGFVPFSPTGAQLLFNFCSERYLTGSLAITTNLEFSAWTEVFGDGRLVGALLDRLTHRCHILQFKGDSYRFKQSLQRQEA